MVTLESAELVEADGVGAEHNLGWLLSAEAKPALIDVDLRRAIQLSQLAHERHLPQLGPSTAMDGVLQAPGPFVVPNQRKGVEGALDQDVGLLQLRLLWCREVPRWPKRPPAKPKRSRPRAPDQLELADIKMDVPVSDDRCIEIVANGLFLWHGAMEAVDDTMVSSVTRAGDA